MKQLFSSHPGVGETLRALLIFSSVPLAWWLAVLFIRVPPGQRWRVVRNLLHTPVLFLYLLVPGAIVPAIALWWCVGSVRAGGPAATPFAPFWFGSYIAIAIAYSWRRMQRKAPGLRE